MRHLSHILGSFDAIRSLPLVSMAVVDLGKTTASLVYCFEHAVFDFRERFVGCVDGQRLERGTLISRAWTLILNM